MINSFKTYLNEARGTSLSGLLFLPRIGYYDQLMIPISSSMFKRIWPDTLRATVFHTTDGKGVKEIARLQGKKKQISAFFEMQSRYMDIGVATQGGVHSVLEMDADVLLSAQGDVMSHLDQKGRRWTSISDLKETSRYTKFTKVETDLQKMFDPLVKKYLKKGEFQENATVWELWRMAERKVDKKTMSLIIKDYIDGMEKVIKKNIDTFESAMMSYAKKRSTDYSWDEQIVNNFQVKTAHFFKLKLLRGENSLLPEQQELMEFAKSKGWKTKMWDMPIGLEIYTRKVAKKELREMKSFTEYNTCDCFGHELTEAEYQGKKVELNNPTRASDGKKKFYVYVKNEKGNVIKLGFGDPNMEIKRDDPARRKAFRARHSCDDDIGPKYKARYWSCYQWRAGAKVEN